MLSAPVKITYPEDPERCQGLYAGDQCQNKRYNNQTNFCILHGATGTLKIEKKIIDRNYNLGKWQNRVNQLADSTGVKSLREEIGIARMLLESILLKCADHMDLLVYTPKIADLLTRIERLVVQCNRLETASGLLVDKQIILNLSTMVITIISEHVKDPTIIESISNQIAEAVIGSQN